MKPFALSHSNVTREKLLFCKPRQHHPQLALHWMLSLCWPAALGLSEHNVHLLPPLFHTDGSSYTWQQEWHFFLSTSSNASVIASWFLWGLKRFLWWGKNLITQLHLHHLRFKGNILTSCHTCCISFWGQNPSTTKHVCVLCTLIIMKEEQTFKIE